MELGREPGGCCEPPAPRPPRPSGCLAEELAALGSRLVPETYAAVAALVLRAESAGARVHVTGIGKPEHVASYAASLLASTGTAATFLHGTEVIHGSAGQVQAGDVVVAISNSGETHELRSAVQAVRSRGAHLVAVTGNARSWLAQEADHVLDAGVAREGGPLGLAPRASVAAEVAVLAALAAESKRAAASRAPTITRAIRPESSARSRVPDPGPARSERVPVSGRASPVS